MTVPASDRLSQLYTGNGVNTRFDFTFRVFDQEDATGIAVKVDLGTEFETMDESLYQVTINQDNLGGYVAFNTAPSNQTSFYIAGETPVDQALDITNYDNFYPDSIEKSLDKLTAILQEWSHLLGFEEQARKLSNIKYDESAQLRENQIKTELQSNIDFIEQNTSAKLQEAIANGTVSALAITTVESESDLANLLTWDGRTVAVAGIGNYKYNSASQAWERDFITDRQVVTVDTFEEMLDLSKWEGRTIFVKNEGFFYVLGGLWKSLLLKSIYSKFKFTTVHNALNRLKTYSDYGYDKQALGFNDSAFASMFDDSETDNDIFLPGKLSLSGKLYGTSNNATLLSLLGNNGNSFKSQIVAGDTKLLSEYGMSEDVLVYTGITGRQALITLNPTFSNDSIVVNDSVDLSDVKIGSIVKTSDGFWGHVSKIENKKLTVINWYRTGVLGLPIGTSATLNHIDKVYLANKVIWCPSNFTGSKIVGEEWDFMNASLNSGERTGLDMVIHDASTKDMDTAHLVRSGKYGVSWLTGFQAQGVKYSGFLNADGVSGQTASLAGFAEVSTAQVGMYFNGGNAFAFKFRYSPSSVVYPTLINTYGFTIKSGKITKSASSGISIDLSAMNWFINNTSSEFTVVLPSNELVTGQELELLIFGVNQVKFKCLNTNIKVNNLDEYLYTPSVTYKKMKAIWNGSGWFIFS